MRPQSVLRQSVVARVLFTSRMAICEGKEAALEKHTVFSNVQEASRRPIYIKGTLCCSTRTKVRFRYSIHELRRAEAFHETLGK